ncbi:MAG TPA: hypothetical protein VMH24_03845 [Candidatus Sulfotelmatobacter sp.]|nr:hypothetical protein [Candidatus Sulfotelmatobacter sp.]
MSRLHRLAAGLAVAAVVVIAAACSTVGATPSPTEMMESPSPSASMMDHSPMPSDTMMEESPSPSAP